MSKNRYYYYEQETRAFVEVEPHRAVRLVHAAAVVIVALVVAAGLTYGMDARWIGTPEEAKLRAENEALHEQMTDVEKRIRALSGRLDGLAEHDQSLYRTLLGAEPIPEDVRRVGVGGADPYAGFRRFGGTTASLLRKTAAAIDQLEREASLQRASYRELSVLAERRQAELAQLPALLPTEGPVVSGYGLRRHPVLRVKKMHAGIDVLVPEGSAIIAPGDGVVKRVGRSPSFGRFLEIEHAELGYTTRYAHLSSVPEYIRKGRAVKRGERIASSGSTGRSTGPHLHYEVRDAEGRAVNPVYFFAPSMTPEAYRALLEQAEASGASLD